MEWVGLVTLAASLLAAGSAGLVSLAWTRRVARVWEDTAQELGLEHTSDFSEGHVMQGEIDGRRVVVRSRGGAPKQSGMYVEVYDPGAVVRGVRLSREWFMRGPGSTELQLGERSFDRQLYLEGPDDVVAALLDVGVRHRLQAALQRFDVWVEGPRVQARAAGTPLLADQPLACVREMLDLSAALRGDGRSIPQRLLDNAMNDPVPEVRLTNLRLLLKHHGQSEEGQQALDLALDTGEADLKLLRARNLRDGAIDALCALIADQTAPELTRVQALDLAKKIAGFTDRLEGLLQMTTGRIRGATAERAAEVRHNAVVPLLRAELASAAAEALPGMCRALGVLGDEQAEPALIALLEHPSNEVKQEAALALVTVGTVRAVESLLALTTGLLRPPGVKAAARQAVTAIQAGLEGAEAGELSLVAGGGEGGDLSLAEDGGDLSLAEDRSP